MHRAPRPASSAMPAQQHFNNFPLRQKQQLKVPKQRAHACAAGWALPTLQEWRTLCKKRGVKELQGLERRFPRLLLPGDWLQDSKKTK